MKASAGFIFFMLFLAGIALVNLKSMQQRTGTIIMSASEIADKAWRPTYLGEMQLSDDSRMIIRFLAGIESSIAGHSGCNRFTANYELFEGAMKIDSIVSTRMACPEPDNSLEKSFLEALHSARSLARKEDRLVMKDQSGLIVARFTATDLDDAM